MIAVPPAMYAKASRAPMVPLLAQRGNGPKLRPKPAAGRTGSLPLHKLQGSLHYMVPREPQLVKHYLPRR
jgi:hypothetical protein